MSHRSRSPLFALAQTFAASASFALGLVPTDPATGGECAPLPHQKACSAPLLRNCCKPRRKVVEPDVEMQEKLAEEVTAAVAKAMLAAERERLGTTGAGAGAPAVFGTPTPAGTVAGASSSIGLRGLEIHLPELKLALPTITLPSLIRFRRDPELYVDSSRAPLIQGGTGAGAAGPGSFGGGILPQGAIGPGSAPATGTRATGAGGDRASGSPARSLRRPRPAKPRCNPEIETSWDDGSDDDDGSAVEQCAPLPPSTGPAVRRREPVYAPAADSELDLMPESLPHSSTELPPLPTSERRLRQELDTARREIAATRRQIDELTAVLSRHLPDDSRTEPLPNGSTRAQRAARLTQRLESEPSADDVEAATAPLPEAQRNRSVERVGHAPTARLGRAESARRASLERR